MSDEITNTEHISLQIIRKEGLILSVHRQKSSQKKSE